MWSNNVSVLDRKGENISTIKDSKLKGATQMYVLDNDDILVWCHTVLHFSSDGRKLNVLLKKADGLSKLVSIYWDR